MLTDVNLGYWVTATSFLGLCSYKGDRMPWEVKQTEAQQETIFLLRQDFK